VRVRRGEREMKAGKGAPGGGTCQLHNREGDEGIEMILPLLRASNMFDPTSSMRERKRMILAFAR
jgi:hypothetical protein